jgi:hypothetical protein
MEVNGKKRKLFYLDKLLGYGFSSYPKRKAESKRENIFAVLAAFRGVLYLLDLM